MSPDPSSRSEPGSRTPVGTVISVSPAKSERGFRDGLAGSLSPVSDAIVDTALGRAESERLRAEEYARTVVAEARSESKRIVEEARADGVEAATKIASVQMAEARRHAHETVLVARRRAYETLRRSALDALGERLASSEGRRLAQRLAQLLRERLDDAVTTSPSGPKGLWLQARSGNRFCEVGPDLLVDQVLSSMAEEVEALWS